MEYFFVDIKVSLPGICMYPYCEKGEKKRICLWDHLFSPIYQTCQDLKLLHFGTVSADRQHGHRHWQGYQRAGAPEAPLRTNRAVARREIEQNQRKLP